MVSINDDDPELQACARGHRSSVRQSVPSMCFIRICFWPLPRVSCCLGDLKTYALSAVGVSWRAEGRQQKLAKAKESRRRRKDAGEGDEADRAHQRQPGRKDDGSTSSTQEAEKAPEGRQRKEKARGGRRKRDNIAKKERAT